MRWDDNELQDEPLPTIRGLFPSLGEGILVLVIYVPLLLFALWAGARIMGR